MPWFFGPLDDINWDTMTLVQIFWIASSRGELRRWNYARLVQAASKIHWQHYGYKYTNGKRRAQ